jgi:peptidoglycan/xylan/chitin deacetylase (PgdA/CDA1 family)
MVLDHAKRDKTPLWHNNAIVCLTFDNMGNAVQVGWRQQAGPIVDDPVQILGYPRVLALLEELNLRASFFIEGWNALHHGELIRDIARRGHEIGLHGWLHEEFHELDAIDAERVISDSLAAFRAIGIDPQGFRAPGGRLGPHGLELLHKYKVGFDSSVDERAIDTIPRLLGHGIWNVPWLWQLIDFYQYHMHPDGPQSPAQYETLLHATLDHAIAQGGVVTPIFHAAVSGVDDQSLEVLRRFLDRAAKDDRVTIVTARQLAERASLA